VEEFDALGKEGLSMGRSSVGGAWERGVRLGRPASRARHLEGVKRMVREGLSAAEIGRRPGLPYSTTSEMAREAKRTTASRC
jgi:hypothetical protein